MIIFKKLKTKHLWWHITQEIFLENEYFLSDDFHFLSLCKNNFIFHFSSIAGDRSHGRYFKQSEQENESLQNLWKGEGSELPVGSQEQLPEHSSNLQYPYARGATTSALSRNSGSQEAASGAVEVKITTVAAIHGSACRIRKFLLPLLLSSRSDLAAGERAREQSVQLLPPAPQLPLYTHSLACQQPQPKAAGRWCSPTFVFHSTSHESPSIVSTLFFIPSFSGVWEGVATFWSLQLRNVRW